MGGQLEGFPDGPRFLPRGQLELVGPGGQGNLLWLRRIVYQKVCGLTIECLPGAMEHRGHGKGPAVAPGILLGGAAKGQGRDHAAQEQVLRPGPAPARGEW